MYSEMCPKTKSQCFNHKLLERISRDVISDIFVDVSKDKTLFTLLNRPLEIISRDMVSDVFPGMSTKQVMTIVSCIMTSLAQVKDLCLNLMINVTDHE